MIRHFVRQLHDNCHANRLYIQPLCAASETNSVFCNNCMVRIVSATAMAMSTLRDVSSAKAITQNPHVQPKWIPPRCHNNVQKHIVGCPIYSIAVAIRHTYGPYIVLFATMATATTTTEIEPPAMKLISSTTTTTTTSCMRVRICTHNFDKCARVHGANHDHELDLCKSANAECTFDSSGVQYLSMRKIAYGTIRSGEHFLYTLKIESFRRSAFCDSTHDSAVPHVTWLAMPCRKIDTENRVRSCHFSC